MTFIKGGLHSTIQGIGQCYLRKFELITYNSKTKIVLHTYFYGNWYLSLIVSKISAILSVSSSFLEFSAFSLTKLMYKMLYQIFVGGL